MRGASKSTTTARGGRCATTCGPSAPPTWCAGSWTAGRASAPRGAATSGQVQGASCWTTCSARATRPRWASAGTWACPSTTAATRRTPGSFAQVPTSGCQRDYVVLRTNEQFSLPASLSPFQPHSRKRSCFHFTSHKSFVSHFSISVVYIFKIKHVFYISYSWVGFLFGFYHILVCFVCQFQHQLQD